MIICMHSEAITTLEMKYVKDKREKVYGEKVCGSSAIERRAGMSHYNVCNIEVVTASSLTSRRLHKE